MIFSLFPGSGRGDKVFDLFTIIVSVTKNWLIDS